MSDSRNLLQRLLIKARDIKTSASTGFKLTPSDVSGLRTGVESANTVSFIYTRKDGRTLVYNGIEPYEIKQGFFWGFHKKHGSIHKFALSRIRSVKKNQASFIPRDFSKD